MAEVPIDIKVISKQALSSLKVIEKSAKKSTSTFATMGKSIVVLNQGFALAGKIWGKFSGAISDVTNLAGIQQKAMNDLKFAMQGAGEVGNTAAEDFARFAGELQAVTTFGDEVTMSAAAMFTQLTKVTGEGLKQATIAGQNLAATLGIDLETAMRMIAKSTEDGGSGLKRYNVSVEKGATEAETLANAIQGINDKMGGKAQNEMNTFSGLTTALGNAWGDAKEMIGFYIIENDSLLKLLKGTLNVLSNLPKHIKTVVSWFQDNAEALRNVGIALGIATGAYAAYTLATNGAAIATSVLTIATKAYVVAQKLTPWGLVIASVAALSAGVFLLTKNWDLVIAKTKVFSADLIDTVFPAIKHVMVAIEGLVGIFNKDLANSIMQRRMDLQNLASSLRESGETELEAIKEQNILKQEEAAIHEQTITDIEKTAADVRTENFANANKKLIVNNNSLFQSMKAEKAALVKYENMTDAQRIQNFQSTMGTIATLSSSGNKALGAIGKAAGIAQATVSTYQAATMALASPPGPPWSFGYVAPVVAAGAANIAKIAGVKGFQDGGIVGGSSTVGDRQLARINSGEMVLDRSAQEKLFETMNNGGMGGQNITVNIQGNVIGEESYIDELARKLTEAVRFRNVELVASGA